MHFFKAEIDQKNQNSPKWQKMAFLEIPGSQIWFHVKSEWQKNAEISTLCHDDRKASK